MTVRQAKQSWRSRASVAWVDGLPPGLFCMLHAACPFACAQLVLQ